MTNTAPHRYREHCPGETEATMICVDCGHEPGDRPAPCPGPHPPAGLTERDEFGTLRWVDFDDESV